MARLVALVLIPAAVAAIAACVKSPATYQCAVDDDCGAGGTCEDDGRCSVADGACPSGRRYHASAGPVAGTCVPPADPPDGPDAPAPDYRLCVAGIELSGDDACAAQVCATQPWCCEVSWDEQCVLAAEAACDRPCSQVLAGAGLDWVGAGTIDGTTYTSRFTGSHAGWVHGVAWGDLDTDDRPDLAVAREAITGAAGVAIYRGGGLSGSNLILTPVSIGGAAIGSMDTVEWRDFDHDDDLDLLASGESGVVLIVQDGGAFTAHTLATETAQAIWADDDGVAPWDVVVIYQGVPGDGDERLVHHRLSGPPYAFDAITAANTLSTLPFTDLVWCDVSNDHRRDVVGAAFGRAVRFVATTSGFAAGEQLQVSGPMVACGDLDDDGDNDLVVSGFDSPLAVLRNDGGFGVATFTSTATFQTGGLALGDLDHDGRLDLVVSDAKQPTENPPEPVPLTLFINTGVPGATWFDARLGPDWNGAERDSKGIDLGPLPRTP